MALVELGQARRAVADLEAGGAATSADPAVAAALAFAWSETGRAADAIRLLRGLHDSEPANLAVAMNLARLLLTATPASVRDPDAALALAARVNETTAAATRGFWAPWPRPSPAPAGQATRLRPGR